MKTGGGSISRAVRLSLAAAAGVIVAGWFVAVAHAASGSAPPNPDTLYERAPASSGDATAPVESAAPPSPAAAAAPAPVAPDTAVESMGAGGGDASTIIVPDSMPAPRIVNQDGAVPPSTTVIPEASGTLPGDAADQNQVINYEVQQNPQLIDPQLHSMQEFMEEGSETSPLGIEVQEDQRKLADGEIAAGLLVVGVVPGSPAAIAGLHPFRQTARNIIEGTAIAAALVFPPAVVVVPLIESVNFHESYDLIIGVDGVRVTNFLDFDDRMRDVQPGEIVYLSLVRNGRRVQLPVPVRSLLKPPGF